MRTWHDIGFTGSATEIISKAVKVEPLELEDVWYGTGPTLERYTMPDGKVYTSYVQACPWSSGPMTFMALKDATESPVAETLWTDEEIESYC